MALWTDKLESPLFVKIMSQALHTYTYAMPVVNLVSVCLTGYIVYFVEYNGSERETQLWLFLYTM